MKLIIEIDTSKLRQDMSPRTRYFGHLLHKKVVEALGRFDLSVGEFDGAVGGRAIIDDEQNIEIGRISID